MEAAAAVFRGRDPSEVSFEEVAEAGGVSRSLVYAYFGDRGGLIAAVYLHGLDELDRDLRRTLDDQLPDEIRLRRLIRQYLVFARDNEAAWNLLVAVGALQHPAVRAARADRIDRIAAAWSTAPEGRLVIRGVIGFLEGAAQHWVDRRDIGLQRATNVLSSVLWNGLAALPGREVVATG